MTAEMTQCTEWVAASYSTLTWPIIWIGALYFFVSSAGRGVGEIFLDLWDEARIRKGKKPLRWDEIRIQRLEEAEWERKKMKE